MLQGFRRVELCGNTSASGFSVQACLLAAVSKGFIVQSRLIGWLTAVIVVSLCLPLDT